MDYFDHEADIGVIGRGSSLEDAFIDAALSMFNIMTDTKLVPAAQKVKIEFVEEDNELALTIWLNFLLAKAHELDMVFSKFELTHTNSKWSGYAFGSKWQEDFTRGTEVKGATLTMLTIKKNTSWEVTCVVDV